MSLIKSNTDKTNWQVHINNIARDLVASEIKQLQEASEFKLLQQFRDLVAFWLEHSPSNMESMGLSLLWNGHCVETLSMSVTHNCSMPLIGVWSLVALNKCIVVLNKCLIIIISCIMHNLLLCCFNTLILKEYSSMCVNICVLKNLSTAIYGI